MTGGGGTGGATGGGGTGGATTSSGGSGAAWEVVDLVDDTLPDGSVIQHKGQSLVSGIWFADTSHGVVALQASSGGTSGGAVERLSSPSKVEEVVVRGAGNGSSNQDTNFVSFFLSPIGLIAGNQFGNELFSSSDSGVTFKHSQLGEGGLPSGITAWISKDTSSNWHYIDTDGHLYIASADPGPSTPWTQTWGGGAPPAGSCENDYKGGHFLFDPQQSFFASPDGQTMIYPRGTNGVPAGVCRSTDGGKTFLPVAFPSPPSGVAESRPQVLVFADAKHGFAARTDDSGGKDAYLYTTSDGGATWTAGKLPADVASSDFSPYFSSGAFAPDGQHAYLVGSWFPSSQEALFLESSDGGQTWVNLSASLQNIEAAKTEIHTVFALDAKNVWIGGDHGALLHSASGSE